MSLRRWCLAASPAILVAILAASDLPSVRTVTMTDRTLAPINTRIRHTTLLVLPEDDPIRVVDCGDPDFWVVEWEGTVARVKPAKPGATSNLNVRTTSNRLYSFILTEIGANKRPHDAKVFIERDASDAAATPPRFVPVEQVHTLQAELTGAQAALTDERQRAAAALNTFREEYPRRLRFDYTPTASGAPFWVRSVWHDGQFTYLRTDARELPTLYEVVDGEPSLISFDVHDGLFVVSKVVDRGYLMIGKKRWNFERR